MTGISKKQVTLFMLSVWVSIVWYNPRIPIFFWNQTLNVKYVILRWSRILVCHKHMVVSYVALAIVYHFSNQNHQSLNPVYRRG